MARKIDGATPRDAKGRRPGRSYVKCAVRMDPDDWQTLQDLALALGFGSPGRPGAAVLLRETATTLLRAAPGKSAVIRNPMGTATIRVMLLDRRGPMPAEVSGAAADAETGG